ncbi:MAG: CDP-alcohol phosphatidyltransferase family protein [Candidatus Omnitrophica bacterium]|nr:CDP-alcohol phosphatidyltransferase family protein [Candidatus Omnitrophota bacterium]
MASIYDFKPHFQNFLRPLISSLVRMKLTPNKITLFALFGSFIVGLLVALHSNDLRWLLIVPVWLFIRMALNAMDGMMAREFNLSSHLGAVLNELGDVLSDLFLYLPLALIDREAAFAVILFSFGAVISEFSGLLGKAIGASRHYEGPMGKSDRAFFIGALSLVTVFLPKILLFWKWLFFFACLLLVMTCWNRLKNALTEVKRLK